MFCVASHSPPWQPVTPRPERCHAKCVDWYLLQLAAIRSHNDELRTRFRGGTISISDEIRELGSIVVAHALLAMTEITSFDDREHRTGRFVFCGRVFRWQTHTRRQTRQGGWMRHNGHRVE